MRHVDVVVIGAGTMGSATAWWLARRGRSVVLAEQFPQGHIRGSSHGRSRIFRLAYPDPRYVRMCQAALPLWRELEADTGTPLLDLVGGFDFGPRGALTALKEAMTVAGAPHEVLAGAAAHERFPGLNFDEDVVFHPDGGRIFAADALGAMQRRAAELGADVRFECPAQLRVTGDAAQVDLGTETVSARAVVVTAGAWVAEVIGASGSTAQLPALTITQEQVAHFRPLQPDVVFPSWIHHVRPWRWGLHTPGEGVKVGGHHEGPATTAETRSGVLDAEKTAALVQYATQWVPGVDPTPQFGATCLYTTTADEEFVIDRVGPLVIGSPCSGHGFKFTPLIGRLLADLTEPNADVASLVDPGHRLP